MNIVYVAYKSETNKPPDLICDGINVSSSGLTFYEDDIGWYFKSGELQITDE